MAISNSTLVRDALGLIGVLGEVEPATSEQAQHGIRVLNEMMLDWAQDGIDLQYFEQTEPGEETPIPPSAVAAVKHFLSFSLAPYYGKTVPPELAAIGAKFYARLTRDAVKDKVAPIQTTLPAGEGHLYIGTASILDG
jgi:hypothetical protein